VKWERPGVDYALNCWGHKTGAGKQEHRRPKKKNLAYDPLHPAKTITMSGRKRGTISRGGDRLLPVAEERRDIKRVCTNSLPPDERKKTKRRVLGDRSTQEKLQKNKRKKRIPLRTSTVSIAHRTRKKKKNPKKVFKTRNKSEFPPQEAKRNLKSFLGKKHRRHHTSQNIKRKQISGKRIHQKTKATPRRKKKKKKENKKPIWQKRDH